VVATASRHPHQSSAGGGPPWIAALVGASGLLAAAGVRRTVRSGKPSWG
jgi:MYXO-CTERM domain-containing protein